MLVRSSSLLFFPLLLSVGCFYDYAGLRGGGPGDAAVPLPGTGGTAATGTAGAQGGLPDGGLPIEEGTGGTVGATGGAAGGPGGAGTGGGGRKNGTGGDATGGRNPGSGGASTGAGGASTGGSGTAGTGGGRDASTGGALGTGGRGGGVGTGGRGGGVGTGGAGAASRILSIDFIGGTTPDRLAGVGGNGAGGALGGGGAGGTAATLVSLPTLAPTEVAGVRPAAHWNGAPGGTGLLTALALGDGTVTTAAVAWASPVSATQRAVWSIGYADAPGDVRMMNGYLDPHGVDAPDAPAVIIVTGLPAALTAGGYDVYVYGSGQVESAGWSRTYRYAIGASELEITQPGPSPAGFAGYVEATDDGRGNYVVFHNVTAPTFTLTATPGASTGGGNRAPVNGIQIVSPSGS